MMLADPQQTAAPDLSRVKSNIATMIDKGAPEADIDAYVASEGVTPDQLRAHAQQDGGELTVDVQTASPPVIKFPYGTDEAHATQQIRTLFAHGAAPEDISAFIKEHGGEFANPDDEQTLLHNYETDAGTGGDPRWRRAYAKTPDYTPFKVAVAQEPVSGGESFATGLRNVGSLNWGDELTAWLRSKIGLSPDGQGPAKLYSPDLSPDQIYQKALQLERAHSNAAWDQHPVAYGAGGAVGMLPSMAIAPGESIPQIMASGAVIGGLNSAGAAEDGQRLGAGLTGATEGAVLGGTLGGAGRWLANRAAARAATAVPTIGQQTAQAAARQGLDVLPADVGGPFVRGMTGATAQFPLGVVPIAKAANRLDNQAAGRVGEIASDLGSAADDAEGIGTAATEGAQKYVKSAKKIGGRMYDAAAEAAGGATVDLANTRNYVDQEIARLEAVPGGGTGLEELRQFRATLDRRYAVQGVRDMRTQNFVDQNFRNTPVEARMKQIANAASQDVENNLRAQGNTKAADLYRAADDNWREMLVNLKRNIEPIVGKLDNLKNPEAVSTALNSAMKKNGGRVASFINSLPAEQQGIVRASMLNPLGRDVSGSFSISKFATDWAKLSPQAQRTVFGPEAKAALQDLADVGAQAKIAKTYANHSNTARGIIASKLIEPVGGGTAALGALAGMKTLGATLIAPYVTGTLLASPRFARWLARADKTTLSPVAYADRLTRIATAEPAIANQVLALQHRIGSAFSGSVARVPDVAVANEPLNKAGGGIGQGQGNAAQQQPEQQGGGQ